MMVVTLLLMVMMIGGGNSGRLLMRGRRSRCGKKLIQRCPVMMMMVNSGGCGNIGHRRNGGRGHLVMMGVMVIGGRGLGMSFGVGAGLVGRRLRGLREALLCGSDRL